MKLNMAKQRLLEANQHCLPPLTYCPVRQIGDAFLQSLYTGTFAEGLLSKSAFQGHTAVDVGGGWGDDLGKSKLPRLLPKHAIRRRGSS